MANPSTSIPDSVSAAFPCVSSPDEHARLHVEQLVEYNRRDTGLTGGATRPWPVRSVAVIGAGLMGTPIAAACVRQGFPVVIHDCHPEILATARARIAAELSQQTGWPEPQCGDAVGRLITETADDLPVAACDLVLESVFEKLEAKQGLFARLEKHLKPAALLATNTSTIPIGRLAERLADPGRLCGIHFFHPVRHRSLVEIVRGPQSTDQAVATAVSFAKAIEKRPIVVADGPGFLVNRLLVPYLNEALEMLLEGAGIAQIEAAATSFGMAMGPLRILDEIGLDTTWLAGRVLYQAFPERVLASPLLVNVLKKGRFGRKVGAGFFAYSNTTSWDGPGMSDPVVEAIIAHWARPPQPFTPEAIVHRLLLPMVLEATRLLEEHRVRDPRDIDVGMLFGLGFPARRGGLLHWADTLGPRRLLELLAPLASLGPRAQPTATLLDMAASGRKFYDECREEVRRS